MLQTGPKVGRTISTDINTTDSSTNVIQPMQIEKIKELLVKLDNILINPSFGTLNFLECKKDLELQMNLFIEIYETGYPEMLAEEEEKYLRSLYDNIINITTQIDEYNIESSNHIQERNGIIHGIKESTKTYNQRLRSVLVYLRTNSSESRIQKAIEKEKGIYKLEIGKLQDLQIERKEKGDLLKSGVSDISFSYLSTPFEKQTEGYKKEMLEYYKYSKYVFRIIVVCLVIMFGVSFCINGDTPLEVLIVRALISTTFVSILFYGLTFLIRNYNIYSNLTIQNQHRKVISDHLGAFIINTANEDSDTKRVFLEEYSKAIFPIPNTGYLSKGNNQSLSNPMIEIVNGVMKNEK